MWYFVFCSDSVVVFVLIRQCGSFCFATLSEQVKNCHTVGTSQKLPHCRNNSKTTTLSEQIKNYHTVGTNQKLPHCRNKAKTTTLSEQNKNYHTIGTKQKLPHCRNKTKSTTLSEQSKTYHTVCKKQKLPHCRFAKINILTLVLSENFFLNETKNHNPPRQCGSFCFVPTVW
jgi:enterochelin esterase-like enzyme